MTNSPMQEILVTYLKKYAFIQCFVLNNNTTIWYSIMVLINPSDVPQSIITKQKCIILTAVSWYRRRTFLSAVRQDQTTLHRDGKVGIVWLCQFDLLSWMWKGRCVRNLSINNIVKFAEWINIPKYTANQRLLVSAIFHVCKHPSPFDVTRSSRHVNINCNSMQFTVRKLYWFLKTGLVDHIGVLQTPVIKIAGYQMNAVRCCLNRCLLSLK